MQNSGTHHVRRPAVHPAQAAPIRRAIARAFVAIALLSILHPAARTQGSLTSAEQYLPNVQMLVQQSVGVAQLGGIVAARWPGYPAGVSINTQGTAGRWQYTFHTLRDRHKVVVVLTGSTPRIVLDTADLSIYTNLTGSWKDSPAAMTALLQNGVQGFLSRSPNAVIDSLQLIQQRGVTQWQIACSDGTDSLRCAIDAVSLQFIGCTTITAMDDPMPAQSFSIGTPHPSPLRARGDALLPVQLGAAASVRITLHDGVGRELLTLHEGPLAPGTTQIAIPVAALPGSGTYYIHAVSAGAVLTRRVQAVF